jgi:uncharacterized protein YjdB/predicted esterase
MPYRLFIPAGYSPDKHYPLVLFLHGAGERGSDNNAPLNGSRGAKLWAEADNQAKHPCFVLVPQCPTASQWVNTNWTLGSYSITKVPVSKELMMVKDIIDTLITKYAVDPSRLYITGLSMGGYGTWDFILRYPQMFKAAIPICGAGDPSKASLIGRLPLRVFHSSDDSTVPVSGSRNMVNAINALGPNTRTEFYTEYTDQGHFSWVNAYNTPDLVDWLFSVDSIKIGLTDITDLSGIIDAQADQPDNQLKENAFDNKPDTKWFDASEANPTTRKSWIQYKLSGNPYVVTQYAITSAKDFPEQDPFSWALLGSIDGIHWNTLDTKTGEVFSGRLKKNTYTFNNSEAYLYYRLQINSVNNPTLASGVQLAELEIFGIPAVANITVSPTVLNISRLDISQLNATVTPVNATKTVTWSSSDLRVATVSSQGLVTAVGAGTATITVSAANNNKTADCIVNVVDNGIVKYEAEKANLNGVYFLKDQAGYSGTGFVANFGNVGNYVQFSITNATAGQQNITLRYATADNANIHLYVNGKVIERLSLNSTGCWGCWTDKVSNVVLNSGNNIIKYQKDVGDGGYLNVDYLSLTGITGTQIHTTNNCTLVYFNREKTSLELFNVEVGSAISVIATSGKIVAKKIANAGSVNINVEGFEHGVYVVNVQSSGNLSLSKAVVI